MVRLPYGEAIETPICCHLQIEVISERLPAFAIEAAATAGALRFWTRFVDVQCSAIDGCTVQSRYGFFTLTVVIHLDKTKTSWLSRITIRADIDASNSSVGFK